MNEAKKLSDNELAQVSGGKQNNVCPKAYTEASAACLGASISDRCEYCEMAGVVPKGGMIHELYFCKLKLGTFEVINTKGFTPVWLP